MNPEASAEQVRGRAFKSEQCAGFKSVLTKEKRCRRFSTLDLIRVNPSSAGLATSALARSSPRHLQRARSAKFPAQKSRASPMKEKRCKRFSTSDLKEQIRAVVVRGTSVHRSLTVFLLCKNTRLLCKDATRRPCRALKEVPRTTCNEREARSSPRDLQRARSAKFPAQPCNEREARSSPRNLATSAKREVPRAGNDVSVYFYKKPRNL